MRTTLLAGLTALLTSSSVTLNAATIQWDPVVTHTTESDILTGGTLVAAVNVAGTLLSTAVVNGVTFTPGNLPRPTTNSAGTFFTGGGGDTGSASLNLLYNSHAWASSPAEISFNLVGLTPGNLYDVQVFAAGDTRTLASTGERWLAVSDGLGNNSGDMQRRNGSSVVGHFMADATTQTLEIIGGSVNGFDPAISGYQVRDVTAAASVPEPGYGMALLGLLGCSAMWRRKRDEHTTDI